MNRSILAARASYPDSIDNEHLAVGSKMMGTGTLSKMRRVRRSEVEWRELFARFDESAQTREAFCTEQDVVLSSIIRWWKKLRQSPRSQAAVVQNPVFVELTSEHEPRWDL